MYTVSATVVIDGPLSGALGKPKAETSKLNAAITSNAQYKSRPIGRRPASRIVILRIYRIFTIRSL
jgi:hypothetical protein